MKALLLTAVAVADFIAEVALTTRGLKRGKPTDFANITDDDAHRDFCGIAIGFNTCTCEVWR